MKKIGIILLVLMIAPSLLIAQEEKFEWPNGEEMALSFTWDDGRASQVKNGTPLLNEYDIKATFYVVPSAIESDLELWKKAVANGHEIGNHSLNHPCSGNFQWSRGTALEEYSETQMREELNQANTRIVDLLGVKANQFAYPCGQTFIGRGINTKSYVPIVAENFMTGRTWLDEAPVDPAYCDLSQITGLEMDGKNFQEIKELIDSAMENGSWLVLAGHDIGDKNPQTTELEMLKKLLPYLKNAKDKIWVAPVGEIASYIKSKRDL